MEYLVKKDIGTMFGEKSIEVYCCDVREFDQRIDILTISAFHQWYKPTPGTILGALDQVGVSIEELSLSPELDLRDFCKTWLSKPLDMPNMAIQRIGCVEMSQYSRDGSLWVDEKDTMLDTLKAYFRMLDVASTQGIEMETIALPLLGAGRQGIDANFTVLPILTECVALLRRNECVKKIMFIEKSAKNAFLIGKKLEDSYAMMKNQYFIVNKKTDDDRLTFISYSSKDKNVADNLCVKLESRGMKCWYAPRDVSRDNYAQAIVEAIERCTHFVVIISANSLKSEHVLNEIDLAFNESSKHIQFKPIRIDTEELSAAMKYYLSRKHWLDATMPPIESRLDEFVDKILNEE